MTDLVFTLGLAFCRLAAVVAGLPIFTALGTPREAVLILTFGITVLVAPTLPVVSTPDSVGEIVLLVGVEVTYGYLVTLGIRAIFQALALAAELMSMQTGLAMATLFDPMQSQNSTMLGSLSTWLAGMVFLGLDLHHEVLLLLAHSFEVVPPGHLAPHVDLASALVVTVGWHLSLGVRLAGPMLAMVFVVNVLVAILARLAPRMNVFFSVGLIATNVGGLVLFWLSLPWILALHTDAVRQIIGAMPRWLGL